MRQAVAGVVQEDGSLPPHGHVLPRVFQHNAPTGDGPELVDQVGPFQGLEFTGRLPEFRRHLGGDFPDARKEGGIDLVFQVEFKDAPVRLRPSPAAILHLVHAVQLPHVGQTVQRQAVFEENGFKPYLEPPPFVFPAMRALAEPVGSGRGDLSPLVLPRQQQLELVQELRVLVVIEIGHLLQTGVQAILRRMGRSPYGGSEARRPGRLPCRTFRPYRAVPPSQRDQEKTAYAGKHVS